MVPLVCSFQTYAPMKSFVPKETLNIQETAQGYTSKSVSLLLRKKRMSSISIEMVTEIRIPHI